jgi:hypothetical protein
MTMDPKVLKGLREAALRDVRYEMRDLIRARVERLLADDIALRGMIESEIRASAKGAVIAAVAERVDRMFDGEGA